MRVDARLCRLEAVMGRRYVAAPSPVEAFDHAAYLRLFEEVTHELTNDEAIELLVAGFRTWLPEVCDAS